MTGLGTQIGTLLAAAAVAAGGLLAGEGAQPSVTPSALVIDAAAGRDGRDLVDAGLRSVDAEVRLPRSAAEARTNIRYFDALGYRVVVAGPDAGAAARATGVPAVRAADLPAALEAASP
jgi:hypothetical protein